MNILRAWTKILVKKKKKGPPTIFYLLCVFGMIFKLYLTYFCTIFTSFMWVSRKEVYFKFQLNFFFLWKLQFTYFYCMSPQKRILFQVWISLFLQCGSHLGSSLYFVKKSLPFMSYSLVFITFLFIGDSIYFLFLH